MTALRIVWTSGYVGSPSYSAMISRPTSESGACTPLGMPIRSRKSRIEMVSTSARSDTTRTVSTSGAATVEPQSESSSQTAVWNSSSRTPRGISRNASYLPLARPGRMRSASSMKRSQWATTSRRAVGHDLPPEVERLVNVGVGQHGLGDEQRHLSAVRVDLVGKVGGRAGRADGVDVVVAAVAPELVGQEVGVALGDQDDRGLHGISMGRRVKH